MKTTLRVAEDGSPVPGHATWRPREQQALDELGTTQFAAGVRATLIAIFLAIIVAVPVIEMVQDYQNNLRKRAAMAANGAKPSELPGRRPRVFNILETFHPPAAPASGGHRNWFGVLPSAKDLRSYENDLLLNSGVGKTVRPWMQWVLTSILGVGSQKVIVGDGGWLYYSDGVQFAAGPGFLDPAQLASRAESGVTPDPRPAIYQFHDELKRLGVELIVLPVPDKATVHPGPLMLKSKTVAPVQNASWLQFMSELRAHGVTVVDMTQKLFDEDSSGRLQFLQKNSHWSPAGVDVTARFLADTVRAKLGFDHNATSNFDRASKRISVESDLSRLLDLPLSRGAQLKAEDSVVAEDVYEVHHTIAKPVADVLLLGDSFVEIFADSSVSTERAGLAEQLSFYLQRPVHSFASHQYGEFDTRTGAGTTREGTSPHCKELSRYRLGVCGSKIGGEQLANLNRPGIPGDSKM